MVLNRKYMVPDRKYMVVTGRKYVVHGQKIFGVLTENMWGTDRNLSKFDVVLNTKYVVHEHKICGAWNIELCYFHLMEACRQGRWWENENRQHVVYRQTFGVQADNMCCTDTQHVV